MPKKKTPKSRRPPVPTFALSNLERMLLVLYHTVPVSVRADLGQRLFHAWTHPPSPDHALANDTRWKAALVRFEGGTLDLSALDDVQAGEAQQKGGA